MFALRTLIIFIKILYTASLSIESVNPISCTAVRVSWSPLSVSVVDHYTVDYINICGNSQSQTFPASASSGVVSGLQEGQQYQFSVSVSFTVSGQTFNSTSDSMTVTGDTLNACDNHFT